MTVTAWVRGSGLVMATVSAQAMKLETTRVMTLASATGLAQVWEWIQAMELESLCLCAELLKAYEAI